jgi:hypothetical protein
MIILKQVKHYPDTNSVEATWVDRTIAPDTEVAEELLPDTTDVEGNITLGKVIPAHIVPGTVTEVQVKCHSYADVQMDMLRADLGADAAEYADLIAQVEANQIPYPEPTPEQIAAEAKAKLREIDLASIRAIREGDTVRMAEWEQKAALIRAAL